MGADAREIAWFVDYIPWPALVVDREGRIIAFNQEVVHGQCAHPAPGAFFREVMPHVWDALEGDAPLSHDQDVDLKQISDGLGRHERVLTRVLPDASSVVFIVNAGALHQGDNDRAQTERLASLGFMAASICHELNNPLTAIRSLVQRLQSDHYDLSDDDVDQSFSLIASNVERVLSISRKLTEFSRVGSATRGPIRIDEPIEAALALTRHRPECANVEFHHSADHSVQIRGHGDQLQQVFQNILVNCAQAMDSEGRIDIVSRRRDGHAEVEISDSGPGIDPALLDRLFEPFYTTKSSDQGSGLGLAISDEIVREHEGRIRVSSTIGFGTSFFIELPLCPRESTN